MKHTKVKDGVPVRLHGVREGAASVVKFVHKCCQCGLMHNVAIKHNGKNPNVKATFDLMD